MKWYENRRSDGVREWWTQRDRNGVYFCIKELGVDRKLRLFVNGSAVMKDFATLSEAQAEAKKMWVPKIKYCFGARHGKYPVGIEARWDTLWFDDFEIARGYREKLIQSGVAVTDIEEREVE